jgi:Domain of unknown function (DUF4304)
VSRRDLDDTFDEVVNLTASKMKEYGFKRRGTILKKIVDGNAAIVEFQRSQGNTSETLSFTVNLAVVCGALLDPESLSLEKAKSYHGHFRVRIGELAPSHQDLWWEIKAGTDSKALSLEVSNLVCDEGVPYILRYLSDRDLIELWESGKSPGLTDGQRLRNLKELREMTRNITV